MEARMQAIEQKLDRVLELLDGVQDNCRKMGQHIDFVERVYDNVKNPLGYVCDKIRTVTGGADAIAGHSLTDADHVYLG